MAAHQAPPSPGFSRQEHWSGLPFPSPMHQSEKWKWSRSVVSDSSRPHRLQPTRLLHPWDFPGKRTGVGCHCLLWGISWFASLELQVDSLPLSHQGSPSGCDPRLIGLAIPLELVSEAHSQVPTDTLNQKLWEWGPAICVLTFPPGDSDARHWSINIQNMSCHCSKAATLHHDQRLTQQIREGDHRYLFLFSKFFRHPGMFLITTPVEGFSNLAEHWN